VLELTFRCDLCGFETANPTMMHVCTVCDRWVCDRCRSTHEESHRTRS